MNYCQKCGARLQENTTVCPMCGFDNAQAEQASAQQNQSYTYNAQQSGPFTAGAQPNQSYTYNTQQGQPFNYGAQNPYGAPAHDPRREPLSVGEIFVSWLLLSIPVVNIVMIIVWLTSDKTNINKKNFAKAALIMYCIGIVLWFLAALVISIVGVGTAVAFDDYIYYMIPLLGL